MKFYTSKYPVNHAYNNKTKENAILPVGTAFVIDGMNGDCFEMRCVGREGIQLMIGINMLQFAFTETDNLDL